MGPGAEPGFSIAFFLFLVVIGLGHPMAIVTGVAAGLLLRRLWLAIVAAMLSTLLANLAMLHGQSAGWRSVDEFSLAFAMSAPVWAAVVYGIRRVTRSRDAV